MRLRVLGNQEMLWIASDSRGLPTLPIQLRPALFAPSDLQPALSLACERGSAARLLSVREIAAGSVSIALTRVDRSNSNLHAGSDGLIHCADVVTIRAITRSLLFAITAFAWAGTPQQVPVQVTNPSLEERDQVPVVDFPRSLGTATFRGRELSYVAVDGMAVHAGDMVLGSVQDIEAVRSGPRPATSRELVGPVRRNLSPAESEFLWPNGVVPYVIDSGVGSMQRERIEAAIKEWNDKTVISLVGRTTEANYVRFSSVESGNCRSRVGMAGGQQAIALPPGGCSVSTVTHEIGHTIGLWHEHQRVDRRKYLELLEDNFDKAMGEWYQAQHPGSGHYDYASVMHYHPLWSSSNGGFVIETIPPGIDIPAAGLSEGDIDGVARLYGRVPEKLTISTNPPGVEILVDRVRYATPVTFDWPEGSIHTIEPPVAETRGRTRYLFGRWNTGGNRLRYVIAGKVGTWLEANFIVQHRVAVWAHPPGAGEVTVTPPSPDGFYTLRTPLRAEAQPNPSGEHKFFQWGGAVWGQHGRSSNPATWQVDRAGKRFEAQFTDLPFFRIQSTVDPFVVYVNDEWRLGPVALLLKDHPDAVQLRVDEVERAPGAGLGRHRFERWSNGGAMSQEIILPKQGGEITAEIVPQFPLSVDVAEEGSGSIQIEPNSLDGYYSEGTPVHITAEPYAGWYFVGWVGEIADQDAAATIEMAHPTHVEAVFSQGRQAVLETAEGINPPSIDADLSVHDRSSGLFVRAPADASEIKFRFETSTPDAEVDLFVNAGVEPLRWVFGTDGRTPIFYADFRSTRPGSSELIIVTPDPNPPRDSLGVYSVSPIVLTPSTKVRGTLVAEIKRDPAARLAAAASPRAQTFVSPPGFDPAPQGIALRNDGPGPLRFVVESDRPWLSAYPNEGSLASGERARIEVSVVTAGVPPETHRGELTIRPIGAGLENASALATVDVTFVAVPSDGGFRSDSQ